MRRKYIVKTPVTVWICVEVEAPNKAVAVIAANERCQEVLPGYVGESRLDRPTHLMVDCDEAWFDPDSCDNCYEMFLSDKAEAELIEGRRE